MLQNLFFTEEPCLKISVCFNSQKGRTCNAEQPHSLNGNPKHLSKSDFSYGTSRTRIVRPCFFKERENNRLKFLNILT